MSKMIQLRNVPDALHRKLKARAATQGMSLSDYLILEIRKIAERPTLQELWDRVRDRGSFELIESPADAVRAERDSH
jgi:antitoxin FitA